MSAQNNNAYNGAFPMPIGSVMYWAGQVSKQAEVINAGWIIPAGQTLLKADYPDLAFLLGPSYSLSDTTFRPPNLLRRDPVDNQWGFFLGVADNPDGDIPSDIGPTKLPPDSADITITANNLPTIQLDYAANSCVKQVRALAFNPASPVAGPAQVYTDQSFLGRDNDSSENPKYQRFSDGTYAVNGFMNYSPNINVGASQVGMQPTAVNFSSGAGPVPIDITAAITLDNDIVPPHISMSVIMKARW
jgi:hypothetical protein